MKITLHGLLRHKKKTTLTIVVTTKDGNAVSGALVDITGLGIHKRVKTMSDGSAKVKLKVKKAGKLPITATRSGYWLVEYDATVR